MQRFDVSAQRLREQNSRFIGKNTNFNCLSIDEKKMRWLSTRRFEKSPRSAACPRGECMSRRNVALASTSTLLALAISAPLAAQESASLPGAAGELEEIVVTGIRGSLQRSLDIKREASGVVDVITSEEIGKFPDSNVAASLQRVPGVSIQRDGPRGEPNGVTIRGFGGDFNETLVDGRRLSTATGNRAIDFSTVGSDFIRSLTVYKTPDVTVSSNSIG